MPSCPNCGALVDESEPFCENCGASVSGNAQQPPQNGQGQQPRGDRGQPPQGGRGQQPPRGQQGQQPAQGGQGQQPPQGQRGQHSPGGQPPGGAYGDNGDSSRREFLKYGVGAAVVAGGGYFAWTTFLSSSGPAETVRNFYTSLDDGNTQKASDMIHSESPKKGTLRSDSSEFANAMLAQVDVSVDSTDVVTETETRATVETTLTVSMGDLGDQTDTMTVELRKEDGEWKIYSSPGL